MPADVMMAFFAGQVVAIASSLMAGAIASTRRGQASVDGNAGLLNAPNTQVALVPSNAIVKHTNVPKKPRGLRWRCRQAGAIQMQDAYDIQQVNGLTLAGLLASLPRSQVVSDLPGRVRLRVASIKGQESLAQFTASALMTGTGIRDVRANALTGSVLIYYDTEHYDKLSTLMNWIVIEQEHTDQPTKE